ncbi:uncharacterized protein LOC132756258 isoform X2 [Ruditapes philippinarum]|uniref:uncharacterized protein LOC132756258 isoform X2 n=1 Tax=Ruditapes philippinarum TaxID=129788 RepID=UPI00295B3C27|nr:uncharacterized protein LOC132756258 isoform X2 [Ruditapes philippinarum]
MKYPDLRTNPMAEKLVLQGHFDAKFRRYGAIGLVGSAISGVVTYYFMKEREKKMTAFLQNLTTESKVNVNERIKKLAFPAGKGIGSAIPLDNSDGSYDEFLAGANISTDLFFLENSVMQTIDPDVTDPMINMFLGGMRDSFNGSRAERIARRKQLNAAREKLAQNMKEGKYAPDSVENKLLVELRRQKKDGVQDENNPLPLGNNYLPRVNLGEDE